MQRTHRMTEVSPADIGREIVIKGWVHKKRNLGGLVFVDMRDRSGFLQVLFDPETVSTAVYERAQGLHNEYVVGIRGVLQKRGGAVNEQLETGAVELRATDLILYSVAETPPFHIEEGSHTKEDLRLKYRYLDLRRPDLQRILMMRSKVTHLVREFLYKEGFLEIETPVLTKSTPEGARDYLVPSRIDNGKFYALPQSPQLFKQLLMVSGFDRYLQITKCFRDEDLRADRQPEFTQIDMEMSFADVDDVIGVNERLLQYVFKEAVGYDVPLPIPRLTYAEAMRRFGSDKPDLRFGMELIDISKVVAEMDFGAFKDTVADGGSVRALVVSGQADMGRKKVDKLVSFVRDYGAKGLFYIQLKEEGVKASFAKFLTEAEMQQIIDTVGAKTGDMVLIIGDADGVVCNALGNLRVHLAKELDLITDTGYRFVWITDFPLFEFSEEENRYTAMHHPFTMVADADRANFDVQKADAKAKAYDIVLNGYELGGGSVRIHEADIQQRMFEALGFSATEAKERFGFLLEAFRYGVPPHAGLAYGLDRLVMLLTGTDNIRDVIAFPKTKDASCLMTNAPDIVDTKQLEELGITVNSEEEE